MSEEKLKLSKILNLELFLEDLLGREIDVVDLNSDNLDIFIKINILNTGQTIYTYDDNNSKNFNVILEIVTSFNN